MQHCATAQSYTPQPPYPPHTSVPTLSALAQLPCCWAGPARPAVMVPLARGVASQVDAATMAELHATGKFDAMPRDVDEAEHSLEMQLPYIQQCMRGKPFTLVPIMVGALSPESETVYGQVCNHASERERERDKSQRQRQSERRERVERERETERQRETERERERQRDRDREIETERQRERTERERDREREQRDREREREWSWRAHSGGGR
jgi:hypothetical protein